MGLVIKALIGAAGAIVIWALGYGGVLLAVGALFGPDARESLSATVSGSLPGVIADVINLVQACYAAAKSAIQR